VTNFDPAEFDTPTSHNDAGDYRHLLDAMRQAGTEGVSGPIGDLNLRIAQDARERERWATQLAEDRKGLLAAAYQLQKASQRLSFDRIKEWIAAALIALGVLLTGAIVYRWIEEPKIEQRLYGCSAAWDAKTGTCKGKWVPLYEKSP
jgi:hypothetical protein